MNRLEQKFTNLSMKVADLMKAENIDVYEVKRFLKYSLSQHKYNFLEGHFAELDSKITMDDILIFLQQFTSFDNPALIRKLILQFIDNQGGQLMTIYDEELQDFLECCPCGDYARAFTEFLQVRSREFKQSHSPDTVSVHFNHSWENNTMTQLRSFQRREFHQVPEMAFRMVKMENRSILVVWQTTEVVIQKLSKDFVRRFSYMKTQGIQQVIVGECEIDFSFQDRPEVYQIKVSNNFETSVVLTRLSLSLSRN